MSKKNTSKTSDSLVIPSGHKPKMIEFKIQVKVLVEIITLLLILFIVLGCAANNKPSRIACSDGFRSETGYVSAESSHSFWVVNSDGYTVEFSKQYCSING